jgi:hypothetical protein
MKHKALIITLLLVLPFSFFSCGKYPDGPDITIRGKVSRLANEWTIHKVETNGADVTHIWLATYPDYLWTIKKDYVYEKLTNGITTTGTWAFDEAKENIIFQEDGSPTPDIYQITRLKNAELWLYQEIGGDKKLMKLIPKED